MDRNALIIGASGGIGMALDDALSLRGWAVTGLSRTHHGLDIASEGSIARVMGDLSGPFQMVIVATGALLVNGAEPEKSVSQVTAPALMDQFAVNAIGPMLVLKHVLPLLARDERAVFAALSARVGSIGDNRIGGWHSYRASKAALNQLIHGAAIELARTHRQAILTCLHPGTVRTKFTARYAGRHKTVSATEAAGNLLGVLDGLTPAQTGQFFDWEGKTIPW